MQSYTNKKVMGDFVVCYVIACLCTLLPSVLTVTEYVKEGINVTLTCPFVESLDILNWEYFSDNTGKTPIVVNDIIYDSGLPFQDRLSIVFQPAQAMYKLIISNFNGNTDVGTYRCYYSGEDIEVFDIVLVDGPSIASIIGNVPVLADVANSLTLACVANTATPGVTYEWRIGERLFPGETDSTLILSPVQPSHNGANITCTAMNTVYNDIQVTSDPVILTVYYSPLTASIIGNVPVFVVSSNSLILTCVTICDLSVVTYEWRLRGEVVTGAITNIFTLSSVQPSYNGANVECTAIITSDSTRATSDPVTLTVYYPPDVKVTYENATEGDRGVTFTCLAAGNPQTYNFGSWKHIAPDGQTVIRELQGDENGDQYTLTLNNVTYEDSGYYECTVNNGVQGFLTDVNQIAMSGYFIIEESPTTLEKDDFVHSELGDAVNIEVSFYSIPEYTSVTWYGTNGHLTHTVNAATVQTTFYSKSVIVDGYVTTLHFDRVKVDDFIPYTVVVSNTRGSASFVKTLKGINVPCTPAKQSFTAEVKNMHTIEISWTGGCNGGTLQTFYIAYKKSSTEEWTLAQEITEHQDGGNYSRTISGLHPGSEYDIRIWAENAKGRSDYLQLSSKTEHDSSDTQTSSVVGAVAGTVVVMLVLVAGVVLLLWRRGIISLNKLPCLYNQSNEPENTHRNDAFDNQDESQSDTYQTLAPSGISETPYDDLNNPRNTREINGEYESLQVTTEKSQYEQLEKETPRNTDSPKREADVVYVNTELN